MFDILDETCKFENVIIIGDMNARIGEYNSDAVRCNIKQMVETRNTKDKNTNRRGEKLIQRISSDELTVVNGRTPADMNGELTYIGHNGGSVIDLALTNQRAQQFVHDFDVKPTDLSDHMMVLLCWGNKREQEERKESSAIKFTGMQTQRKNLKKRWSSL